jgi:GNAT superfamily N-acetyltransferase
MPVLSRGNCLKDQKADVVSGSACAVTIRDNGFHKPLAAQESMTDLFSPRHATPDDMPALERLMEAAIRILLREHLTPEEVAASFSVMGLDTQLIDDETYYVLESDGRIAGCGGWSRRATLFGGNHTAGRSEALLDPARDAARVRAMYTHPDFARRGVGRMILALCEAEAAKEGFRRVELAATMGGLPLYRACGYVDIEPFREPTPSGVSVPLVRMGKVLNQAPPP